MRIPLCLVALCLALSSLLSCQADPNPVGERLTLQVGPARFRVEVASTPDQRALGLMYRGSMAEDEGMVFVFQRDEAQNFWMKNTRLPLSIAYIDYKGVIRDILDMQPYSLEPVPSSGLVRYALELNQGAFQRAGIKVGDQVDLSPLARF